MAAPGIVVSQADAVTPSLGSIFDGKAFFISQRVPSRAQYVDKVRANGGRIVKIEQQAGYLIADHLRKDSAPGSISYRFIDAAIRDGVLPDPKDHPAGPGQGSVRAVGSTAVAPKGTRTQFSAEDDRELWLWVQNALKRGGGTAKGNEIYKQLEARNPRHTFQAWRDRYIKKLMDRPPEGVERLHQEGARDEAAEVPRPAQKEAEKKRRGDGKKPLDRKQAERKPDQDEHLLHQVPEDVGPVETSKRAELDESTLDDFETLLMHAEHIQPLEHDDYEQAWIKWAERFPENTAEEWRDFYQDYALPVYLERQKLKHLKQATKRHDQKQRSQGPKKISPGPSKRKRVTPTPRKTYGNKRARQDHSDMFALEDSENDELISPNVRPTNTICQASQDLTAEGRELALVSADNIVGEDDAQGQQPGSKRSDALSEDMLPTSEANRAARAQLMAEADGEDALLTSETNRAAREQLTAEAGLGGQLTDTHTGQASALNGGKRPFNDSIAAAATSTAYQDTNVEETSSDVNDADVTPKKWQSGLFANKRAQAPSSGDMPDHTSSSGAQDADHGDALTEANLASQQQQHKAQLMRGVDLPEDDEEVDQSAFANTLSTLLGVKPQQATPVEPAVQPQAPDRLIDMPEEEGEDAIELRSEREISDDGDDSNQTLVANDGINIDDAFTQNLDWPMSPQKRPEPEFSSQEQEHSLAVETQVQYPDLGRHSAVQNVEEEEEEGSSQPFGYTEASDKPVWRDEASLFSSQADAKDIVETEDRMNSTLHQSDGAGGDVRLTHQTGREHHDSRNVAVDDQDYEVDLTVPLPDGFSDDEQEMAIEQVIVKPDVQRLKQMESLHLTSNGLPNQPIELSSQETSDSSSMPDELEQQQHRPTASGRAKPADTQALFDAETQQPDLDLPLPPDSDEESELPTYPSLDPPEPRPRFQVPRDRQQLQQEDPLSKIFPPGGLFARPPSQPSTADNAPRPSTTHRQPLGPTPAPKPTPTAPKPRLKSPPKASRVSLPPSLRIPPPADESLDAFLARLSRAGHLQSTVVNALRMTSMRRPVAEMVVYSLKHGRPLPTGVKEIWTAEQDRVATGGNSVAIRRLVEGSGGREGKGWEEYESRVEFLGEWGVE